MPIERAFAPKGRIVVNVVNVMLDSRSPTLDPIRTRRMILNELEKRFPVQRESRSKPKHSFTLTPDKKYLDLDEVKRLLAFAEKRKRLGLANRKGTPLWQWFFIHTALNTGLRVREISDLRCGDGYFKNGAFVLKVREGKGKKEGKVVCSDSFKEKWFWFLDRKQKNNQPTEKESPVFYSPVTGKSLTVRAFQKAFKRLLAQAGLDSGYSPHSLRHTYGTYLNQVSKDIRLVQSQLRHESVRTTQIYASVIPDKVHTAVEQLSALLERK